MNILNFIKRHPVLTYFVLTFAISWGGLVLAIGGFRQLIVPTDKFDTLLPLVILAILAGPSLTGLIMIIPINSKEGLKEYLKEYKDRLFKFKIGVKWYAITLFMGPLIMAAIYLILSLFSDEFLPGILTIDNKINFLIAGLMTGLTAGFFEELGWTGFAVPQLRKRYGVLMVGFVVGLLWAFWHILPGIWLGYASGTVTNTVSLVSYLLDPFMFLVLFRILMVWVYEKTESLFIAMIMHFSLTAAARIIVPIGIVGVPLLIFDLVWVFALLITAFIALRKT